MLANRNEVVHQAYLQYVFAIKLWNYADSNHIDKEIFDCDLTLQLPGGTHVVRDGTFDTAEDIVLGAENNLIISLGFLFITMDQTLQSNGYHRDSRVTYQNMDLRLLVNSVRNAFAHDMLQPIWKINAPAARRVYKFSLGNRVHQIDLSAADGKSFSYTDIGGEGMVFAIVDGVHELLSAKI